MGSGVGGGEGVGGEGGGGRVEADGGRHSLSTQQHIRTGEQTANLCISTPSPMYTCVMSRQ